MGHSNRKRDEWITEIKKQNKRNEYMPD